MGRFLVHVATGPESPTRASLGLLVARTAAAAGHDVSIFLAGDAVDLARPETAGAVQGVGTGSASEHLAALREAGARLYLSGLSSKARGIDAALAGEGAELAPPEKLVELADEADTVLTY